jgi:hypothetical protein
VIRNDKSDPDHANAVTDGPEPPPPEVVIVNTTDAVAEPALFVAVNDTVVPPAGVAAVGVPVMAPVVLLSERPAGSVPLLTANVAAGEPEAVSV